jgi:hypothetical protein
MNWINMAQKIDKGQDLVNKMRKLPVPINCEEFLAYLKNY